jgi:hypothetical protein
MSRDIFGPTSLLKTMWSKDDFLKVSCLYHHLHYFLNFPPHYIFIIMFRFYTSALNEYQHILCLIIYSGFKSQIVCRVSFRRDHSFSIRKTTLLVFKAECIMFSKRTGNKSSSLRVCFTLMLKRFSCNFTYTRDFFKQCK